MIKLKITEHLLNETLSELRSSPKKEKVVLWLGKKMDDNYVVNEIFTPLQQTDYDYFEIPEEGMDELMQKIRVTRNILVAQIHTHPGRAYHSMADDKWAIIRHKGAYSLVLPVFCSSTFLGNFLSQVATYVLDNTNTWVEVDNSNIIIYE
jgi:hypothetical protein